MLLLLANLLSGGSNLLHLFEIAVQVLLTGYTVTTSIAIGVKTEISIVLRSVNLSLRKQKKMQDHEEHMRQHPAFKAMQFLGYDTEEITKAYMYISLLQQNSQNSHTKKAVRNLL